VGRKKRIITLTVLLALLIVGYYVYSTRLLLKWLLTTPIGVTLLVYTPLGAIIRLLYPEPQPPKLTPEPWWNWTYQAPAEPSLEESLAEKLIIESVSLVKVADQPKIYTSRPEVNPYLTDEKEVIDIYDGREALIIFGKAGRAVGRGFPAAGELAEGRLNVTENLRFRFTYKTTLLNHTVGIILSYPINPHGGPNPGMLLSIVEKGALSKVSPNGVHLGRNLYINYLPTEWFSLDIRYIDVWPGFENIIGWRIGVGIDGSFRADLPEDVYELTPKEPYAFAITLDSGLYEPAALIKISVKNGLDQPIIALVIRVGSELVNIPLNFPLKPGERVTAELGLMQPVKVGEVVEVAVRAYYADPNVQAIRYFERPITVTCKGT